jgi:hypothetical protein
MSRTRRSTSSLGARQTPRKIRPLQTPETETESWIENDYSGIRIPHRRSPSKAVDPDVKRFDELCTKIEDDKRTIALLSAENAALKAEIARCQEKIANYPKMKEKYDRLSQSLSQIAEARSHSLRKRPP